jgi:hypothetical protein
MPIIKPPVTTPLAYPASQSKPASEPGMSDWDGKKRYLVLNSSSDKILIESLRSGDAFNRRHVAFY